MNAFNLLLQLDQRIFLKVNSWNGGWLDYFFGWPTHLGENLVCVSLVGIFMWIWDDKYFRNRFIYFVLSALLLGACLHVVKHGIARERPYSFFNDGFQSGAVRVNYLYKMLLSKSFPSGHAALSTMTAILLNAIYGKRLRFLFGLAALISFSRIYVGAHFPLDVVGGIGLGAVIGLMASKILRKINLTSLGSSIKS